MRREKGYEKREQYGEKGRERERKDRRKEK